MEQTKHSVLIIDTELKLVELLCGFLSLNHRVVHSRTSRDALLKMERQQFRTLIMDPTYLGRGAIDILTYFKSSSQMKKNTRLFLFANNLDQEMEKDFAEIITNVLKKPFDPVELISAIEMNSTS